MFRRKLLPSGGGCQASDIARADPAAESRFHAKRRFSSEAVAGYSESPAAARASAGSPYIVMRAILSPSTS
jgi:hypothetical protein